MLLQRGQRGCLGGESSLNLLRGVGRTMWRWRWSQTEVCSQDIRELSLPGCSSCRVNCPLVLREVGEGAWLCTCWERIIEFVNEFKGAVCYSVDLTGLKAPSKCLLGPAVLCGRLRWGFLPCSSFFGWP